MPVLLKGLVPLKYMGLDNSIVALHLDFLTMSSHYNFIGLLVLCHTHSISQSYDEYLKEYRSRSGTSSSKSGGSKHVSLMKAVCVQYSQTGSAKGVYP